MIFRYGTGIIAFIQFVVMSLLGIANGLNSIVTTCHATGNDCISNMIVSLIFFILTTAWFAFIWILGYAAQDRRSKRLAQILIAAELFVALIALFNARHHTDWLGLATSVIDLVLALWVVLLAIRILRAKGGRVTARHPAPSGRPRQRRR